MNTQQEIKNILDFLNELSKNNHREWFHKNKERYREVQDQFNKLTMKLIEGIAAFDEDIKKITVADSTYRIYRDIRFSPNKLPYKTHIGAYMCRGGKKSGFAGYYFHLEATEQDFLGNNLLAVGLYCPENNVLRSVREDIEFNGDAYRKALAAAPEWSMDGNIRLKKIPKGFDKDSPYEDLLRLKEFSPIRMLTNEEVFSDELYNIVIEQFKKIKPINDLLNRSVEYAYEMLNE